MKGTDGRNNNDDRGELRSCLEQFKFTIASVALFSFFINLLMLVPPVFMLQMFDRVLSSRNVETLVMLLVIAFALLVVLGLLEWSRNRVLVRVGARFDAMLSQRLFDTTFLRALRRPTEASNQPLQDLTTLRQFMTGQGVFAFFDAPWTPLFLLVVFLLHPVLGFIATGFVIVLFVLAYANEVITRKPLGAANGRHHQESEFTNKNLRNAEVVEAMGMAPRLRERWRRIHDDVIGLQALASDRSAYLTSASKSLRFIAQISVLATGAYLVVQQQITPGVMIAASIITMRALAPVDQAMHAWRGFVGARGAWGRLEELLKANPERPKHMELPAPEGYLTAEKIVVVPPGSRSPAIRGVDLSLKPGDTLGVIGPSAAGKSTLARALVGIWTTYAGSVRIDGAEIEHWDRDQLGPHIGYLPQDVELFEGTIAENIARFGEVDARGVVDAAKKAGLHEMILHLPEGYDTHIGINSGALSAGQRQRVALARAVYGNPRIVVLDEPNSNLDQAGDEALSETIRRLREDRCTVVLIAHRPAVLDAVDQVLVLRDGKVATLGARQDVLSRLTRASNG